ncbi:MAG: helix-turn-helix domain-containing protein [Sellimonas intestinalis]
MKTVHLSPQQFLVKYRMTKACELLQNTSLPIEHIAYSCGYCSTFSFSKAFRKVNGISPSGYRQFKKVNPYSIDLKRNNLD